MKFNSLLMAGAVAVGLGAFAGTAKAETIYTTTGAPVAHVTTTTSGEQVVKETYTAVGTRKVGMVGNRPYPLKKSHVESNTVIERPTQSNTVVYAPAAGPGVTTSSSTTMTTESTPISYSSGGGKYYTEKGTGYYQDPALNISVRGTGSFND